MSSGNTGRFHSRLMHHPEQAEYEFRMQVAFIEIDTETEESLKILLWVDKDLICRDSLGLSMLNTQI
ncbi:hypothetical protein HBI56_223950 [Parastagonospora nodorum]|nr:hypothetical protein HBH51_024320 [Parastagonospora nodorum]KAH4216257.1 hypothetical protein HBI06_235450 [Parastagonospora nodorum]KAH4226419.1 hypothetical protein HBI05_221630 [Parastagonospora nodorum]KAH4310779.1 hypothetical protein HBI02_099820 [Parastagonospora nodorum]KAH4346257.1 hypothetical protein HBH98_112630 [Parastagonospora nodorum]